MTQKMTERIQSVLSAGLSVRVVGPGVVGVVACEVQWTRLFSLTVRMKTVLDVVGVLAAVMSDAARQSGV